MQNTTFGVPRWLIAVAAGAILLAIIAISGPGNAGAQDATETPTETATATEEASDEEVAAAEVDFAVGDTLVVVDGPLNLRDAAGTGSDARFALDVGSEVEITDGPVSADDFTWYEVVTTDDETGWVAGEFLGTEADTAFDVGDQLVVADGPLNLRDAAGMDADVLFQLETGAAVEITDGPVSADDYTWFEVTTADDDTGWVAGEFLGTEADTGDEIGFEAGDDVVVVDGPLNVRDDSSLDGEVLLQLELDEGGTILSGPVEADDFAWYEIAIDDETSGWVAGEFIGLAGDINVPGEIGFEVGDAVTATVDGMNFRAAAGLDAEVLDTIDIDALFLVQDGPIVADGYTWFQVFNYYYGEGWVAGELMTLDPGGFPLEEGT